MAPFVVILESSKWLLYNFFSPKPEPEVAVMRQIWITKAGPPEVLEMREAPDPEPKAGEVRLRVRTPDTPVLGGYSVGERGLFGYLN